MLIIVSENIKIQYGVFVTELRSGEKQDFPLLNYARWHRVCYVGQLEATERQASAGTPGGAGTAAAAGSAGAAGAP